MRNIKLKSRKNKVAAYVATTFFVVAAIAVTVNVGFLTSTLNLSNNEVLLGALTILFSFTTTVSSMMYLKRRNDFEKIFDVVASIFPDAILVSDDKDKVVLANEAAGKLLNRNIEDVYGASLDELFEEKFADDCYCENQLLDYKREGFHCSLGICKPKYGEDFPVEIVRRELKKEFGSVIILRDISVRAKVQKDAERTMKSAKEIFGALSEGLMIFEHFSTGEYILTDTNVRTKEFYGRSITHMKGNEVREVFSPVLSSKLLEAFFNATKEKGAYEFDDIEYFNGKMKRALHYKVSQVDERNYAVIMEDLTEIKFLQLNSTEFEKNFWLLAENSLAGVIVLREGVFKYVNPAFTQIFGYTRDEVIGRMNPTAISHPEDRDVFVKNVIRGIKSRDKYVYFNFKGVTKFGETIEVLLQGKEIVLHNQVMLLATIINVQSVNVEHARDRRKSSAKIATDLHPLYANMQLFRTDKEFVELLSEYVRQLEDKEAEFSQVKSKPLAA